MSRRILGALGFAFVAFVSFSYAASLLFNHPRHMAAADSHYHFAVAREIWSGSLAPDVARGLPWTVLRDMPVDHYWGYHLLVAPFGAIADPTRGMKLAASTLFAVVFVALYSFLRARAVPFAWAWALLPAMFSTQDWRYLHLRGGQIVLPLLFALVHVAFFEEAMRPARRRAILVLLAYLGMLSYHGAIILLPMHLAGAAALALFGRDRSRLVDAPFVAAGLALGLTLNPYMDARASTWRFAAYHLLYMGRDASHLYDELEVAEFRPFPLPVLLAHPEWLSLLALALAAIAWVAWRVRRGEASRDEVVLAALVLAGAALTARAMRVREYSVPLAVALFAVLARRAPSLGAWLAARNGRLRALDARTVRLARVGSAAVLAALLGLGLTYHWPQTWLLIDSHLPTDEYAGAEPLLEANGARPILNVAEADYCMLKWRKTDVVCVQGLSRYFIYPDRALYDDIWQIHDKVDTSPDAAAALRRFFARGVRLVATHGTHKLAAWAERHPEVLVERWRSPRSGASIWEILPE